MIHKADKQLKEIWLERFNALPLSARKALKAALWDLHKDALTRAGYCWAKHKAPMALYWKVVGVYSGHLARAIKLDSRGITVAELRKALKAEEPEEPAHGSEAAYRGDFFNRTKTR